MDGSSDHDGPADGREAQPDGRADVAEQRDRSDRMEQHSRRSTDVTGTGDREGADDEQVGARADRAPDRTAAERTGAQSEAEAANEHLD